MFIFANVNIYYAVNNMFEICGYNYAVNIQLFEIDMLFYCRK